MECPQCVKQFDLEDAEIITDIVKHEGIQRIDLQLHCPNCNEQAFFTFIAENDFTPNSN